MALNAGDTLLNGQYRILRQLGRGGFGHVYLAQDTLLGEQVAIKELMPSLVGDETMLKRFLAEAKATMRLTHEGIVRTHNVFSERGHYYIAMEYMGGGSLEARLQRGSLPVDETVRIAADVCDGLSYAHARGVVHCDLKPANILFTGDGRAKVADFGIAHVSEQLLTRTWQTSATFVAGTLPYMSPEQADGVRDDPRVDVYALGAVIFRMLTGRTYLEFNQLETPGAQADNVLRLRSEQAVPPSSYNRRIPAWLDSVILKALSKQPQERYATTADLRAALQKGQGGTPDTPSPRPEPGPALERHRGPALERHRGAAPPRPQPVPRTRLPAWFWWVAGSAAGLFLTIVIVTALALSCEPGGTETPFVTVVVLPESSSLPPPTVVLPTVAPLPTPQQPTATPAPYFQDDFSDPASGWDVFDNGTSVASYQNGEYRVAVLEKSLIAWGTPNLPKELADFRITVDARAVEGPLDNTLGFMVRLKPDGENFYRFQISSDGYYTADLMQAGEYVTLEKWTASSAIRQGLGATNQLELICAGDQFRFYVNGTPLTVITDSTFASGAIGLTAGTYEEPGVVVHFDNLVVRELQN